MVQILAQKKDAGREDACCVQCSVRSRVNGDGRTRCAVARHVAMGAVRMREEVCSDGWIALQCWGFCCGLLSLRAVRGGKRECGKRFAVVGRVFACGVDGVGVGVVGFVREWGGARPGLPGGDTHGRGHSRMVNSTFHLEDQTPAEVWSQCPNVVLGHM